MIIDAFRARRAFTELAALDESVFSLDRAALAIGLEEYPELDIDMYLRRLDTLAARTEMVIGSDRSILNVIEGLNEALFIQEGLKGSDDDYYDPRNSFINEVLDRKIGIPITLSVIYMEVARRIGIQLEGVGFPGHFLVKHTEKEKPILIDVFNQGRIVTQSNLQELLDRIYGGSVSVQPAFVHGMDKKAIISRMLFNLKGIYYQKEDHIRALSIVERILILNPGVPSEIRDRGLLFMQTSLFAKALADLDYYLKYASAPEDTSNIQGHVKTLRNIVCSAD